MSTGLFRGWLVERDDAAQVHSRIAELNHNCPLQAREVRVAVEYSSLNYKDLLAVEGHPGIVKEFPHVPGIDAAGAVVESRDDRYPIGAAVLVTGYELGQKHWGGWAGEIQVPGDWLVPMPDSWSPRDAMILGTAGFTAALCLLALQRNGVQATSGDVVVTGATGGVGSLAVQLLVQSGYSVVAVTGKQSRREALLQLGVKRVMSREELLQANRPLQSARWAGGIDTVGGDLLTHLLRQVHYGGAVAACGLVAGADLSMTLYPFLLRGVALCGVASADCPRDRRQVIWQRLSAAWKFQVPSDWLTEVDLQGLAECIEQMRERRLAGRVIVRVSPRE